MSMEGEIIKVCDDMAKQYMGEGRTHLQIERAFNIAHREIINRLRHNISTDKHGETEVWLEELGVKNE